MQDLPQNPELRSACLIFNPVAGQSDPDRDLAQIRAILEPGIDLDICLTTKEVGADSLARAAVERGVEAIIASGGDGTLSAAAAAVVGTEIPLGIISRGTANAFATALGIPDTIEAACQTILQGVTRKVDAAYCNGQPMVLLAGVGFEAETVELADREAKNRFGMLAYVFAGLQQLQNLEPFEVSIETEEKVITVSAAAVTVANAAPPTSILAQGSAGIEVDDGLLDVTIVAPATKTGAVAAAYHLFQSASSGTATERDDIGYLRANRFKIIATPPQKVVLDGEMAGTTPIDVACVPRGLTIFVPSLPEVEPIEKLEGLPDLVVEFKDSSGFDELQV
ncbi:YegS/Rv2252/BmrU family lipid kinase [Altericista sp. CCNU0014]|uniref:YegS/Rv2252/BmrU family lipid kinase n=1 Tax=Altericista sp. CCNU0014 TaxID=3082949 RepID=UPI00384A8B4C